MNEQNIRIKSLIDNKMGYRGEIMVTYKFFNDVPKIYEVGDKIAQLIILPYPEVSYTEVENLSETDRGENGHGSSGN